MRLLRLLLPVSTLILAVACTSITPGTSPGATIPPVSSFVPSSIPPAGIPTVAPGGATSGACALITEAEMSSIVGAPMSVTSSEATECTWSPPAVLPTVVVRYESGESIQDGKLIAQGNGRDLTIGGNPAYYGEFAGSLLWIEKGGRTLVVQAIWGRRGDEAVQTISQVGEVVISRF